MGDVELVPRDREIADLVMSDDAADIVAEYAAKITQRATRTAPVSRSGSNGRPPGYLRDHIRAVRSRDAASVYVDVVSAARTPTGFPYGRLQESRRHYLHAAIR